MKRKFDKGMDTETRTIKLSVADWIEIVCALQTKERHILCGDLGPEEEPGEDKRWTDHLFAIRNKIEDELYGRQGVRR